MVTDQLLGEADSKIVDSIVSGWSRDSLPLCLVPSWLPNWLCGTWFEKALRSVSLWAAEKDLGALEALIRGR